MDYGIDVTEDRGLLIGTCPDLPEVRVQAAERQGLLEAAARAVDAALIDRMTRFEAIPASSPSGGDRVEVPMQTQVVARLHQALRDSGSTRADIARALGQHRASVDRVFNPKHGSSLSAMDRVLQGLGRRFVVSTEPSSGAVKALRPPSLLPRTAAGWVAQGAGLALTLGIFIWGVAPGDSNINGFFESRAARYAVESRLPYWREARPESLRPTALEPNGDATIILADTNDAMLECEAGLSAGVSTPYSGVLPLRTAEARAAADGACQEAAAIARRLVWDFPMPEEEGAPKWVKAYLPPAVLNFQQNPSSAGFEQALMNAAAPGSDVRILSRKGMRFEVTASALGGKVLVCLGPTPFSVHEQGEGGAKGLIISEKATAAGARICGAAAEAQSG